MPESGGSEQAIGTIHRAGPIVDKIQRCVDCGSILCNYQNAMVQVGQSFPSGWAEGAEVTYWGPLDGTNQSVVGAHHPAIRCRDIPA